MSQLKWSFSRTRYSHSTVNLINGAIVSSHMAAQRKIYDPRQNGPPRNQPPSFELPNQKIEVKLQLRKHINSVLQCLQNDLQQHNMDDVSPDPAMNSIIVSGYPPVNGFDEHTVLAIVKRRDPQATLLSSRFL